MTNDQFEVVAEIIRAKSGPLKEAARDVLVRGMGPFEAARAHDVDTPQQVSNAVRRIRVTDEKIRRVYLPQQADAS